MSTDQTVMCSVGSCIHNTKEQNLCNLGTIQVSACAKSDSGAPYDETLCASYASKQNKK